MLKIFESQDGSSSVFSEKFEVGYHSKYGAIQESRHVFIKAGLHSKAIGRSSLSILEVGLGTGLNTYLSILEAERLGLCIEYTGIEPYPLPFELVEKLNFPEQLNSPRSYFEAIHKLEWGKRQDLSPHFSMKKIQGAIQEVSIPKKFDLIYYDAFSPRVQPELWEEEMMKKCHEALAEGGAMVTYCAKGDFKRTLRSIGFRVEVLKGPPGKREMTRAVRE